MSVSLSTSNNLIGSGTIGSGTIGGGSTEIMPLGRDSSGGGGGGSTSYCTSITVVYGTGSSAPYHAYSCEPYSAPSVAVYNIQGTHVMTVGWGGHVDGNCKRLISGCAGNKVTQEIDVQPGQVISYSVGAGGHCWNGSYTCGSTMCGGDGLHCTGSGSGGILIEWGEGIE